VISYLQNGHISPWLMNTDRPIRYVEWNISVGHLYSQQYLQNLQTLTIA